MPPQCEVSLGELAADPHPLLARLRERAPVCWVPALGGWLVTGYSAAVEVLGDPSTESMLGPVTRAVVNLGSSTVNAAGSPSTSTAAEYPVTSHAPRAGTQQTGARSRSRASSGCGSAASSPRLTSHCGGTVRD